MANLAVIGGGAFGTSLAIFSASIGHRVRVWCVEHDLPDIVGATGENTLYLPGCPIDPGIVFSNDIPWVLEDVNLVLLVCPSAHMRNTSATIAPHLPPDVLIVSAAKGIENDSLKLMRQVQEETIPGHLERIAYLSGPSFARDLAAGLPTNLACAAVDIDIARRVQDLLHSGRLRVYTSDDVVGVELGGALKNVIAIACGVADGLNMGASARASLMTRGLAEMSRLGVALGAEPLTFLGLAGVGDLMLTCSDDLSRNRTFGKRLASGETAEEIVNSQRAVAEGYVTARAVHQLAAKIRVDMPISEAVYRTCYEGTSWLEEVENLIQREKKDEFQGL